MSPAAHNLAAHLRSVQGRDDLEGDVYAFAAEERTAGAGYPDELTIAGVDWSIEWAPSELAIREILLELAEESDGEGKVAVLTPLATEDLMRDVKSRLAGRRVLPFDPWEALKALFEVSTVDGALRKSSGGRELARALLSRYEHRLPESVASDRFGPELAWQLFKRRVLDQTPPAEDLGDWLSWAAATPEGIQTLLGDVPETVRDALADRLETVHGPEAQFIFRLWRRGVEETNVRRAGAWALAAGLVVDVAVKGRKREPAAAWTNQVWGALTATLLPGESTDESILEAIGAEASRAIESERLTVDDRQEVGSHVDRLLRALPGEGARRLAEMTPVSEAGWHARLDEMARALEAACVLHDETLRAADDVETALEDLRAALELLREHDFADQRPSRIQTIASAVRLASWLVAGKHPGESDQTHADLGRRYLENDAFADILRERLQLGEVAPEIQGVVEEVVERAREVTERDGEQFGNKLAADLASDADPAGAFGIHQFLERVVTPIAEDHPVCVLVLDGMSWSVAWRLLDDEPLAGKWTSWVPEEGEARLPMYATVPSETNYSRMSLLSGEVRAGGQHDEKKAFPQGLVEHGAVGTESKASLFHKAELDAAGPGTVGKEVRDALGDDGDDVVGVVVNAVDDALSGSDQQLIDWSIDDIAPLQTLLKLAAHRVVILVADHGHVWDGRDHRSGGTGSERWRSADHPAGECEVRVSAPMVETLTGESEIVVPWSQRIRYTQPKAGYHGGISMQEMVTPVVAVTHNDEDLSEIGFGRISPEKPEWWRFNPTIESPDLKTPDSASEDPDQVDWLAETSSVSAADVDLDWLDDLLDSETFHERRRRHAPDVDPDDFGRLLAHLHANDDTLDLADAARLFDMSAGRMKVELSPIRSTLNVEGYPV
ncbi:MAG: BREX-2 system phosphatase PglZ, partial [Bradymonadaceae bacterium]